MLQGTDKCSCELQDFSLFKKSGSSDKAVLSTINMYGTVQLLSAAQESQCKSL